jgi:hypothetical protein
VFVEKPEDVVEEHRKMSLLLSNLRIPATLRVVLLGSGVNTYEVLVRGREVTDPRIEQALAGDPWWESLRQLREHNIDLARESSRSPTPSHGRRGPSPRGRSSTLPHQGRSSLSSHHLNSLLDSLSLAASQQNGLRISRTLTHPAAVSEMPTPDGSDYDSDEEDYDSSDDSGLDSVFPPYSRHGRSQSFDGSLPDDPRSRLLSSRVPRRRYGSADLAQSAPLSRTAYPAATSLETLLEGGPTSYSPCSDNPFQDEDDGGRPVAKKTEGSDGDDGDGDGRDAGASSSRPPSRSRSRQGRPPLSRAASATSTASALPTFEFNDLPCRAQMVRTLYHSKRVLTLKALPLSCRGASGHLERTIQPAFGRGHRYYNHESVIWSPPSHFYSC